MSDLDIIKQLEQEIGIKLEKVSFNYFSHRNSYAVDGSNYVISLNLSSSNLEYFPNNITKLTNLRVLSLRNNKLKELPNNIGQLQNLQALHLGTNYIKNLPLEIGKLRKLEELYVGTNELELFPNICSLEKLQIIHLDNNLIEEIPPQVSNLGKLKRLQLDSNHIKILPTSILNVNLEILWIEWFESKGIENIITVANNPLTSPTSEIIKQGQQAIIDYFQSLEESRKPLNEAKVLFVGQGEVGKTSLVKRLLGAEFNPHENKTDGINIENWTLPVNEHQVQLNLWDFGGQEIMHATHQFFLTKRSLYILVLDARQDEQQSRIEYWLKLIQSFGDKSPIIIVINKIDQHQLQLNKRGLQEKYAGIQAFIETSCQDNKGIDELKQAIQNNLAHMPHIHDLLPANWFDLKQRLETEQKDYISYEKYQNLCKYRKIKDESHQKTLLGFLHDLGIVLCFQDDNRLQDTSVLNPEWVTQGIYNLLNANKLFHSKGVLHYDDLDALLGDRYQDKHQLIIDMMKKFKLCFEIAENQYLIPDLLPKEEPFINWDYNNSLAFQFHYDILPTSIMSRFIVKMHRNILGKNYWFSGVILKLDNNQALIKSDVEDKKIQIWVTGNAKGKRSFLQIMRHKLKDIHKDLHKINAREIVVYQGVELEYQDLLNAEECGETDYFIAKLKKRVPLAELLDGIDEKEVREQLEKTDLPNEPSTFEKEKFAFEKFKFNGQIIFWIIMGIVGVATFVLKILGIF